MQSTKSSLFSNQTGRKMIRGGGGGGVRGVKRKRGGRREVGKKK